MTRNRNIARRGGLVIALLAGALFAFAAGTAGAAVITIVNNDGAGEGFNDPTPRAPVGGNPGVTLGQQRLYVFQYAANIWGNILTSNVVIQVRAQFNPQTCTATQAVLGSAGPTSIHANFSQAPVLNHWYYQSLANRLEGVDLSANPDINATFNSNIDAGCFGPGLVWYYGVDGLEGANIELLPVVLHEIGHGLGFSTQTSGTTGNYNGGLPTIYDKFLMDTTLGLHWNQMTAAQRVASAISLDKLVWDGPAAIYSAAAYLGPRPELLVNSPGVIAGTYKVQTASFGPQSYNLTGNVVLADDGVGDVNDVCEPVINGGALAGNIALVMRGTCTFVAKALAVQAAGAIGMIVVNNVAAGLPGMGGSDPSITIPCIGISQANGNAIIANLGGGVNATLWFNPAFKAGADNSGRPLMYAPNPFAGGSSVSHWDVSMNPNALMEPAATASLHDVVDLTKAHFVDIGWFPGSVATTLQDFAAEGRADGVFLRWRFADPEDVTGVTVERTEDPAGAWSPLAVEIDRGSTWSALDASATAGVLYHYRLAVTDRAGEAVVLGQVSGERTTGGMTRTFVRMAPNPAVEGSFVSFGLSRPEHVRLVVTDVRGRKVRTIEEGMLLDGHYTRHWDGRSDQGERVPAGVYFVNLRTSAGVTTQRVTLVR